MHTLNPRNRILFQYLCAILLFTASVLQAQQAGPAAMQMTGNEPLGSADAYPGTPTAAPPVANYKATASELRSSTSQLQPAVEVLTGVLVQYQKAGNRDAQSSTLCALGNAYNEAGQRQKAVEQFQQALRLYRETGDKAGEVKALSHLGDTYRGWGFPDMAIRFYREALQGYTQVDDKSARAIALNNLGVAYLSLRDKKKTLEFLNLALAAYRDSGDRHGEALAYINIGAAESMLAHDSEKALEWLQKAVLKLEPLNDRDNQADAFEMMGVIWAGLHKQELSEANFKRALGLYRETQNAKGEASVLKQMRIQGVGEDVASTR